MSFVFYLLVFYLLVKVPYIIFVERCFGVPTLLPLLLPCGSVVLSSRCSDVLLR